MQYNFTISTGDEIKTIKVTAADLDTAKKAFNQWRVKQKQELKVIKIDYWVQTNAEPKKKTIEF